MIWTPEIVYLRFLEAAETERRLPGIPRPKEFGNGMPDYIHDIGDANRQEPTRDKAAFAFERAKAPPRSGMVTRHDECVTWGISYFPPQDARLRILWMAVFCAVFRKSFQKECRKKGWSRTTSYRRLDAALSHLSERLNSACIPVAEADLAEVEHLVHKNRTSNLNSACSA